MVAQRKQIIITSDTYPKEWRGSIAVDFPIRFGPDGAIEPPELEMRVAILLRKAESESGRCLKRLPFSSPSTCAAMCAS